MEIWEMTGGLERAALINRLPLLLNTLRNEDGFAIGAGEWALAHRLLLRLAETGDLPADPSRLKGLIGPILCASPAEQELFSFRFDLWMAAAAPSPTQDATETVGQTIERAARRLNRRPWVIGALLFAVVCGAIGSFGLRLPPGRLTATLAGVLVLAVLARDIYFRLLVARVLKRGPVENPMRQAHFQSGVEKPALFSSRGVHNLAVAMRRQEPFGTGDLDVEATIAKTLLAGKRFTPVAARFRRTPAYLVLVDRRSQRDHAAARIDALLDELDRRDAPVTRYYFDQDPSLCRRPDALAPPVRLEALARRHPGHRLLAFGGPEEWSEKTVRTLSAWRFRAFLSLGPFPQNGPGDHPLAGAGFAVFPADAAGLTAAVRMFNGEEPAFDAEESEVMALPPVVVADTIAMRWQEPPRPDAVEQLIRFLKRLMGDDSGWFWLCACAVYPELRFQLTLHLGKVLTVETAPAGIKDRLVRAVSGWFPFRKRHRGRSLFSEKRLLTMIRLPWFRHGAMPDWLRRRLIQDDDFRGHKENAARVALFQVLAGIGMSGGMEMTAAETLDPVVRRVMKRWGRKAPAGSSLRDPVFLAFMTDPLSVRLPREAARFIRGLLKKKMPTEEPPQPPPPPTPPPKKIITNRYGMRFIYIQPGQFLMGSPKDEPGQFDDEKQHKVILTQGFYMQETPVTQGQWEAVMGNNPSHFKEGGPECPVEQVSWEDAQEFLQKLNDKSSELEYRLPTEAQWEYACRAGTTTPFWTGKCLSTDEANYNGNYPLEGCPKGVYREKTTPVKKFPPNPWGLYDMHGNVWEWCADWFGDYPDGTVTDPGGPTNGASRVSRGGSWVYDARRCRSACRDHYSPDYRVIILGFRALAVRRRPLAS